MCGFSRKEPTRSIGMTWRSVSAGPRSMYQGIPIDALAQRQRGSAFDVPVTDCRECWPNAERHEGARMLDHHLLGDVCGAAEFLGRLDDVIGRHDEHDTVGII